MSGRPRPPKQRCAGCGGDSYGYVEGAPCSRCKKVWQADRAGLAADLKAARLARRASR